jgi:hypothetical protein
LEPIQGIDLLSPLGVKARISFGTIYQGIILVNNDNFYIIGGQLTSLNLVPPLERVEHYFATKLQYKLFIRIPKTSKKPSADISGRMEVFPTLNNVIANSKDMSIDRQLNKQELDIVMNFDEKSNQCTGGDDENYWDDDVFVLEQEIAFITEPKKKNYQEYELEECIDCFAESRFVRARIDSHSKLICKDGFLLNATIKSDRTSKLDVLFENKEYRT